MKILVVAEHDNTFFKAVNAHTLSAAKTLGRCEILSTKQEYTSMQ